MKVKLLMKKVVKTYKNLILIKFKKLLIKLLSKNYKKFYLKKMINLIKMKICLKTISLKP